MSTADDVRRDLHAHADAEKARFLERFFKTGPGQYAAGDVLIGITVPQQRKVARSHLDVDVDAIEALLASPVHEERLTALLILVEQFRRADTPTKERLVRLYLANTAHVDNWDLVDSSAPQILGAWLADKDRSLLGVLAGSDVLWERRIAVVATHAFVRLGQYRDAIDVCRRLLGDSHDLIHKAVGWTLREVGKRSPETLKEFLDEHAATMPRTALRYAIERLPEPERRAYLQAGRRR